MKLLFALLLLLHGLIHIIGFLVPWKLANIPEFSGKTIIPLSSGTSKFIGALWLIVMLLFLVTTVFYFMEKMNWWITGVIALVLSQVLIILFWPDAKAGTIANLIILPVLLVGYGNWNMDRLFEKERTSLLSPVTSLSPIPINRNTIGHLPPPVIQWLQHADVIGKAPPRAIRLHQTGRLRTTPDGKWMPVSAVQYVRLSEPAFLWKARIDAGPLLHISGRDKYIDGHGNMLIKFLSLVTIANAKGPETDQGSLLRFLGEMVWYPSAAIMGYLDWEHLDSTSARVTMTYEGVTGSGIFRFSETGDITQFEAERFYEKEGQFSLETWLVSIHKYDTFEGIRMPASMSVTWKLDEGDFTWYEFDLTGLEILK